MSTLLLKWGTLKNWSGYKEYPGATEALDRYFSEPSSASAMMVDDTPSQKQAICDLIDAWGGDIQNDWSGEIYESKQAAKDYVMNYGMK